MLLSRLIVAAVVAVVPAFVLTPASARPCDEDNAKCSASAGPTAAATLRALLEDSEPAAVAASATPAVSNSATRVTKVRPRDHLVKQTSAVARAKKTAPTPGSATSIAKHSEP